MSDTTLIQRLDEILEDEELHHRYAEPIGIARRALEQQAAQIEALRAYAERLRAECAKSHRCSVMLGDIVHSQVLAMQAAVIEGHLITPADGLQWVVNTLDGPGQLPDLEDARAIGGAQAWFDRETASHEEFRLHHPATNAALRQEQEGTNG